MRGHLTPANHAPEVVITAGKARRRAKVQADGTFVFRNLPRKTVEIRVDDEGVGFSTDELTSGFGLIGIRERVGLLGGELSVTSSPGGGTSVRASVPASHRADAGDAVGGVASTRRAV